MELAFQRWGKSLPNSPEKTRILLLHGMGGTGLLWRPIGAVLEDDFDLLSPDQRGHGKSWVKGPTIASYSPLDYAQDLLETLQSQDFKPCYIIGHSMGVRSACALAHLKPDWVRGLILVDLGMDGLAGGGLGEGLARFIRVLPSEFASREAARTFMAQNCPDPSIAQYLMAVSVPRPAEQGGGITFPFDHDALLRTIDQARGVSIRPWVQEAAGRAIPILLLRGEKSLVWPKAQYDLERSQFKDSPNVRFEEVHGAGHGLPFEKRAEFISLIRDFTGQ